jgi:DUF971 family protein
MTTNDTPKPRPTNITLNRETGFLIIDWASGEQCEYPLNELREACPCVECRGGHHNMGIRNAPQDILSLTPARSYKVENVQMVGSYAIQFLWDDGHQTGIYTWDYLFHLCPKFKGDNA